MSDYKTFPELTRLDRCDRCQGQAMIAYLKKNTWLLVFCGDCSDKHALALVRAGFEAEDQTMKLLDTPYVY